MSFRKLLFAAPFFAIRCWSDEACTSVSKNQCVIEIDADAPVQPLAVTLAPKVKVTVRVKNKDPFSRIKFAFTRSELERESGEEKLLQYATAALLGFPFPFIESAKATDPATEIAAMAATDALAMKSPGRQILPKKEQLQSIADKQLKVDQQLQDLESKVRQHKTDMRKYETATYTDDTVFRKATCTIRTKTESLIKDLSPPVIKKDIGKEKRGGDAKSEPDPCASQTKTEGPIGADSRPDGEGKIGTDPLRSGEIQVLTEQMKGVSEALQFLANLQNASGQFDWLSQLYTRQISIEARSKQLKETLADLITVKKTLDQLAAQKTPLSAEKTFDVQADTETEVTITSISYLDAEKTELVKVKVVGRAAPWLGLSAGVMISSLVKTSYEVVGTRVAPVPPATTVGSALSIAETKTKPSVLPLGLLHVMPPSWRWRCGSRECAFGFAAGAGVNPFGDATTGEFGGGASFRIGRIYLSPMVHAGRPLRLGGNYKVNDPVASGFSVPTERYWKRAFGIAITYGVK